MVALFASMTDHVVAGMGPLQAVMSLAIVIIAAWQDGQLTSGIRICCTHFQRRQPNDACSCSEKASAVDEIDSNFL